MITKNTKITVGVVIGLLGFLSITAFGLIKYIDSHVDSRIAPISKQIESVHLDVREIRKYLMGDK